MQMNMTFRYKKFPRGGPLAAMAISAMLLLGSAPTADAGHYNGHTFSGVVTGGALGGLLGGAIGGKKAIVPGIVGGAIVGGVLTSRPPPPPHQPQPYYTPAPVYSCGLVCGIQGSLIKLGYNPGPVDGAYGQRTADAISAFEYNNQLPVTGQATPQIHNYMKQLGG